jgi:hypothetical protein
MSFTPLPRLLLVERRPAGWDFVRGHCECTRSDTRGQFSKSSAICGFLNRNPEGAVLRREGWKAASDAAFDGLRHSLIAIERTALPGWYSRYPHVKHRKCRVRIGPVMALAGVPRSSNSGRLALVVFNLRFARPRTPHAIPTHLLALVPEAVRLRTGFVHGRTFG